MHILQSLRIGSLHLSIPLIMAPMAGYTDQPFRQLLRTYTSSLMFTEMVSAYGLMHDSPETFEYLQKGNDEHPLGAQLFGADPKIMAGAAKIIERMGFDIVDINAGCPVPKIIKNNAGAALMKTPEVLHDIIKAMKDAVSIPVSVKTRLGWTQEDCIRLPERLAGIEKSGADIIIVHGRTRTQGFSGTIQYSVLANAKKAVSIPFIANGDIRDYRSCDHMIQETHCDGVMIGRGALGSPWLFRDLTAYYTDGTLPQRTSPQEACIVMEKHFKALYNYYGEYKACLFIRRIGKDYIRGFSGAKSIRIALSAVAAKDEFVQVVQQWKRACTA